MKDYTLITAERKIVLELAQSARKALEEIHAGKGTCKHCDRDASLHYWPAGTCTGQSRWDPNPKHFEPNTELVTKYDSIIKRLS